LALQRSRRNELLLWYDADGSEVNVWRDLAERWQETLDADRKLSNKEKKTPLLVGEAEGVLF
jgi:hypothetical protein